MPRPIKAAISLDALRHNLAVVRRHAPRASVFAVIKANAYGHGVLRAARALAGADGIALLEIDDAVRLRDAGFGKRLALLQGVFEAAELQVAAAHDLTIVIHNQEQLRMLDAARDSARFDVLLKIDTGMNRLGFTPRAARDVLAGLKHHRAVRRLTLMTHFATADDARGVAWQMQAFDEIAAGSKLQRCLANSAAILRYPETHADWVRPGIMLYGCTPFADVTAEQLGLQPAMTLASEIIAVRELRPGERIGYGGTFEATQAKRVGIVACGYADGYPRHAPTGTPILVGGRRARTLGRVSMDMLCIDLSGISTAQIGTPVTLWGEGLSADEVAAAAGTVSYELLCALAPRVPVIEA
ncbi:MAG: alanine racemase [Betaproteobacteria bacterium]|nr:alanine racemase [Betaproteobacteria bacterium]